MRHAVDCRQYEVWTPIAEPDDAEPINDVMRTKINAVRAHRSQMVEFRYDRAIAGQNAYRGVMMRCGRFAEAFALKQFTAGDGGEA